MGTILQERAAAGHSKLSIREREKTLSDGYVTRTKMGNRSQNNKSQKKSMQPQNAVTCQDNTQSGEKKLEQRRQRYKPNSSSVKHNTSQYSTQGHSDSKSSSATSIMDGKEKKVQLVSQCNRHREQNHAGARRSRRALSLDLNTPSKPTHYLPKSQTPNLEMVKLCEYRDGDIDSDSDLSESERLPVSPSSCTPPQLKLRDEVINPNDFPPHIPGQRGQSHGSLSFPDFLPPSFNSWNLCQLPVFFNMEGRGAPHPRPVGQLEKYLEWQLQLEWHQIKTVQEESGNNNLVSTSCHQPHTATSSRLSSPKSILQCQRAFPLTFLSSNPSGCGCRYRQSRMSPLPERRDRVSLPPKRSYSESRVQMSDKSLESWPQRLGSPARGKSHIRRMQALGNIRNAVQTPTSKSQSVIRDSSVGAGRELGCIRGREDALSRDFSQVGFRRNESERRRSESERRTSGSERRISESERRRESGSKGQDLKPNAGSAIKYNLTGSKNSTTVMPNGRLKQVEFIT